VSGIAAVLVTTTTTIATAFSQMIFPLEFKLMKQQHAWSEERLILFET